jgi:hypothetical protein
MFIKQLKDQLKWVGINMVYKLKDLLPRTWYYRLLQWLVKTSVLTWYEKVCVKKDLQLATIYSILESVKTNAVKYFI